jgi:hypothetical protein
MSLVTSTPTVLICSSRCESAHYFAGGVWMERTHVRCYAVNFRLARWDERRAKIILRWTFGGSARALACGFQRPRWKHRADGGPPQGVRRGRRTRQPGAAVLPFRDGNGRLNFLSREGREGGEVRRTGIFVETAA